MAMTMKIILKNQCSATPIAQYVNVIHTRETATIFTLNGIALCSRKLRI